MLNHDEFDHMKRLEQVKRKNRLCNKTASLIQADHFETITNSMRDEWKAFDIKLDINRKETDHNDEDENNNTSLLAGDGD